MGLVIRALLLSAALFIIHICNAQSDPGASDMKTGVDNRSFTFVAQSASPQKGGMIRLTGSTYTLKVKGDTLICDLPYYGRVYNPTYGGDAGLKFTSNKFNYKVTPRKKGGWNVKIGTSDLTTNRDLFLTIFENGNASLNVAANDRQSISYQGMVEVKK
ncbi:MAG TPA: DUF4251 domain-containing protein [Cyclobacteriaceae bacterium]|nr:DUF4251 domain-containing protein [Cyclobacteriaceae bacterium]